MSSYKILSQQEPREVDIENDFSSSLSSDGSQDSLDLVLINIGSKQQNKTRNKRRLRRKDHNARMRLDGFDTATESYEELLGSAKRRRQFLILGGLCVLAIAVIGAIVLSVVLINRPSDENNLEEVKLEDILLGRLQPKRFDGTWVDGSSYYYVDISTGNFILYDAAKKEPKIIMEQNSSLYNQFMAGMSHEFSADKNYILMQTQFLKLFRHSFLAEWKILDIANNRMLNVTIGDEQPSIYRLVKFAPTGNGLIIIHKNNIYYKADPLAAEVQVTKDGIENETSVIMNGVTDWVYEEEVFSTNGASWFSPDGKKLAYIQFDDTHVPAIGVPHYGAPGQFQYPLINEIKYPKAGAPNPLVKLFYADFDGINAGNADQKVFNLSVPTELASEEHLITSVAWANDNTLISVWMNRVQNKAIIYKCIVGGVCSNVHTIESTTGWVEFYTSPFFNKDGTQMVYIEPYNDYRHVQVLDLTTNTVTPRTSGKYIVTEILKYNQENDVIIYTANLESDIKAQHVYAVKNEAGKTPECLTCELHEGYTYYGADISEDGKVLVINANGPGVPRVDSYLLHVEDSKISLTNHTEIESNDGLRKTLEGKKMPSKAYEVVSLDADTEAYVMMIKPPNFDETKKYPMLIDVYGGPDSSSVTNRWSIEWGTYLASSHGIIYAKIDGRGSGLRSNSHLHKLYKRLGTVEVEDQARTVQELTKKHSYIDEMRVGIWGWSYGGYVSGMSLMQNNEVFKCATSVAPVTDWTLYDTIYTERYMLLPKDNFNAYNVSRMMNFINNISEEKGKKYMLVHGTMDDNVHFQQGMVLARTLERADIAFREISYPDEDHALAHVRPHLYHSLERFFKDCFDLTT